ncbi:hypothetical protein F4810DRAFT_325737 [Camillea tinctor]|nr:hypothetical protein F4810DRAFT_325737 [Camillea tinctor]
MYKQNTLQLGRRLAAHHSSRLSVSVSEHAIVFLIGGTSIDEYFTYLLQSRNFDYNSRAALLIRFCSIMTITLDLGGGLFSRLNSHNLGYYNIEVT